VRIRPAKAKKACWVMIYLIQGSLVVKLPTMWTDGKAKVGRIRQEKRIRKKIREEKELEERGCRRTKRKKNRDTVCFSNEEGRKVGSLKRRVRSHGPR
jgi:hypothetical protein